MKPPVRWNISGCVPATSIRIFELILSEVMGLKYPSFDFTKIHSMSFTDIFSRFSIISSRNLLKTSLIPYSVFPTGCSLKSAITNYSGKWGNTIKIRSELENPWKWRYCKIMIFCWIKLFSYWCHIVFIYVIWSNHRLYHFQTKCSLLYMVISIFSPGDKVSTFSLISV